MSNEERMAFTPQLNQNMVKSFDSKTRRAKVDRNLIESEFLYALSHSKVDLYKETEFKMKENRFIIIGTPV